MPLYTYKCVDCGETFDVRHSMSEKYTDCSSVGCTEKKQLVKILKPIVLRKKETEEQKVGSINQNDSYIINNISIINYNQHSFAVVYFLCIAKTFVCV